MKFYNLRHKSFETDFNLVPLKSLQLTPAWLNNHHLRQFDPWGSKICSTICFYDFAGENIAGDKRNMRVETRL